MNSTTADNHIFLMGHPPLNEYLNFVAFMSGEGQNANLRIITDEWRSANDHVLELERTEAGWADGPTIAALPIQLEPLATAVLANPMVHRSFLLPTRIALVELDRLVVYQKHINLAYVESIKEKLGSSPNAETVFKACLPVDHTLPPIRVQQTNINTWVFVSPTSDLRFLDASLLEPSQICGYRSAGPIFKVLGVVVGCGSNYLNSIHVENRLVLNNGSHRAFALRDLGITHVPCLIQGVSRREELPITGNSDLQATPDRYLRALRPPLLKDYFDPKLRKVLPIQRRLHQVTIQYAQLPGDVPAL